ncbi:uncharacterized protein LOC121624125 isoform X5 [Chelmon rostratus]|uniref:uncharacterized protein LOC121624125 isoform X5 n=1 Tax=Chelmon rostratus TaxID=109905 RepID=UPI001BE8EAC8|nr:uncharacterized protein LOC121624125 isoform X5 [Chelmon rostratus]
MIKMRSFLLFLLSLMTGYQAKSEGKGCQQGWVEFTCKYPEPNGKDTNIDADDPTQTNTHSSEKDDWEIKGSFSLFYETKDKKVRVAIKQLEHEDFGVDRCTCSQLECVTDTEEPDQGDGKHGCQTPFVQTAYRTAKTTITCDYPGNTHQSSVKDFCKDSDLICEDILSTKSSPGSKAKFTLTETSSGFNVSISDVSSQDAGVYWCGVESNEGPYRATLRKIQLQVKDITTFSRSPTAGKDFTYWCQYPNKALTKKFICKGEDPSICQRQASTEPLKENTKFSMRDDKEKRNITITVREVTTDDTGTYWCGAESNYPGRSNLFFHKFSMTVSSTPVPTSSVSSTQSTASASAESHGETACLQNNKRRKRKMFTFLWLSGHHNSDYLCSCVAAAVRANFDPYLQTIFTFKKKRWSDGTASQRGSCLRGDAGVRPDAGLRKCSKHDLCHRQLSHKSLCLTVLLYHQLSRHQQQSWW